MLSVSCVSNIEGYPYLNLTGIAEKLSLFFMIDVTINQTEKERKEEWVKKISLKNC